MQQIMFKGLDQRLAEFLLAEAERTGSDTIRMTHEPVSYTHLHFAVPFIGQHVVYKHQRAVFREIPQQIDQPLLAQILEAKRLQLLFCLRSYQLLYLLQDCLLYTSASEILFGIYYNLSVWYKVSDRTHYGATFSVIGLLVTLAVIYLSLIHI